MKALPPLAMLFLGLSTVACGSSSDGSGDGTPATASCEPRSANACPCSDGSLATQTCQDDGLSYGVCECPAGTAPIDTGSGSNGGGSGGSNAGSGSGGATSSGGASSSGGVTGSAGGSPPVTGGPSTGSGSTYDELYACALDTGWGGDEFCVLAPDPADGFQLHYGPTDYDNPDDVAFFTLDAGAEIDDEVPLVTGNTTDILYQEMHIRLRPGTHHMIMWANDGGGGLPGSGRYMFGAQGALNGGRDDRPRGDVAPENVGVGYTMAAQTPVSFNMHYVNTTTEALLREGWVNIHYADPANVAEIADPIAFWGALGLNIPPQSSQTVGASCAAPAAPARAISLAGHMHAHGARFSAWLNDELVYETYNWSEPAEFIYDSVQQNATPDAATYTDGGHTGILNVNPGDTMRYECEMVNDTDAALTFGNHTYTAEMCLLFGSYAPTQGGPWSCVSF